MPAILDRVMKFTQQNVDANFALVHDLANAQELGGLMAEVAQNAQVGS